MDPATRRLVAERARDRCEYCQLHQDDSPLAPLHVEHIIARKHGGGDALDNLALACIDCNLHKGANLTGIDPQTQAVTRLFHPRRDVWAAHFEWRASLLLIRGRNSPNSCQ
jgi:5-methylcytosine-specific restriction endonuclease McrA